MYYFVLTLVNTNLMQYRSSINAKILIDKSLLHLVYKLMSFHYFRLLNHGKFNEKKYI